MNDNAPSFVHKNYKATIVENIDLNPPAKIVQVHAMDPDDGSYGTVSYSIVGGNLDGEFIISIPSLNDIHSFRHYISFRSFLFQTCFE